ncbi:MAG: DMT family transporter [Candidatus Bipolaricaulota bacterium]
MGVLLALAAAASWGVAMTVAKPGAKHVDPITFLLFRWLLALPLAAAYGAAVGALQWPSIEGALWVLLGSALNAVVGWILYLLAMERAPAYQITALASTAPLWGVVGAIVLGGEPFRWTAFVAALLVVVGAAFLVEGRRDELRAARRGAVLALVAGVLWGVSETVPMRLAATAGVTPATSLVLFAMTAVAGNALALPFLRGRVPRRLDKTGLWLVALSTLTGALLGWLFWLNGLRYAPASLLAPVRGSTLLFTFLFSVLFLGERPSRRALVGVLLSFGGVLLVSINV